MGDITQLLHDARAGKPGAHESLYRRIYDELHKIARASLFKAPAITVLDAPALVHEAYLRFAGRGELPAAANRHLFYGYAANVMRSVIVDALREKRAAKRGAGEAKVTLQTRNLGEPMRDPDVERLVDALEDLRKVDPRCCEIVEMRYFGGLSIDEIAQVMALSTATIERQWKKARAFLFDAMKDRG